MSNRWQMQGSYVWSQLDGASRDHANSTTSRIVYDYTNPNNALDFVVGAAAAAPTISRTRFKLLGSYQAPWGINVGAELPGAERPADRSNADRGDAHRARANIPVEPRGTYRASTLSSAVAARRQGRSGSAATARRSSRKLHNVLNSERRPEQLRRADPELREPGRIRRGAARRRR